MSTNPFVSNTSPAPGYIPQNGHRAYHPLCEDLACRYVLVGGRRCRRAAGRTGNGLCVHHDRQLQKFRNAESRAVASQAIGKTRRFTSVMSINRLMGRVLTLGLARRYSPRELFVFTCAAKLLLQTVPQADDEIVRADGYYPPETGLPDFLEASREELDRLHEEALHAETESYEARNSDFDRWPGGVSPHTEIDPSKPASNGDAAEPSKVQPNVTHPIDCELVDVIEENPDAAADRDDEDEDDEDRSEDTTEADDDQNDDQEDRPAATITKSRNHGNAGRNSRNDDDDDPDDPKNSGGNNTPPPAVLAAPSFARAVPVKPPFRRPVSRSAFPFLRTLLNHTKRAIPARVVTLRTQSASALLRIPKSKRANPHPKISHHTHHKRASSQPPQRVQKFSNVLEFKIPSRGRYALAFHNAPTSHKNDRRDPRHSLPVSLNIIPFGSGRTRGSHPNDRRHDSWKHRRFGPVNRISPSVLLQWRTPLPDAKRLQTSDRDGRPRKNGNRLAPSRSANSNHKS